MRSWLATLPELAWPAAGISAVAIAPAARRWLDRASQARLLGAFGSACNLVNQDGDVLSLLADSLPMTPLALCLPAPCAEPFAHLSDDSRVTVTKRELMVANLRIATEGARLWHAAPGWPAVKAALSDPARRSWLAQIAAATAAPGAALHVTGIGCGALRSQGRLRAAGAAERLVAGLRALDAGEAVAGAQRLAGLGPGLTPAGDDFLLGALLAAWAGLFGPGAQDLAPAIAEAVAPLTTTLSAAYVRAAGRGECSACWHGLFAAARAGRDAALRHAVRAVLAVGHSSGADAMAGFVSALV
jgi:hypothetical protein